MSGQDRKKRKSLKVGGDLHPQVSELTKPDKPLGQREGDLGNSEEQYRLLFAGNPQPMFIYELDTLAILEVNEAMVRHYGYSREEFLALTLKDLRLQEEIPELLELISQLPPGYAFHPARNYRKKDGTVIEVEIASHGLSFNGKKARLVLASDITERRQDEAALRKEKNFSNAIIDSLPGIFYMFDEQGKFIRWNKRLEEVGGYSAAEMAALHPTAFFTGEDQELIAGKIKEALATGEAEAEAFLVTKSGDKIPYFFTGLRIVVGDKLYLLGLGIDITPRQGAEEALKESEERYRRITGAVTDYIYTVAVEDGRAVHTVHSPPCVAVTGYTSEEFAADPFLWVNMVLEEDKELVRRQAASLLSGEDPGPLEHRLRRKDGIVRWVSNVPVLHRDSSGKFISYDGLISDITARKLAEEALRQSEERLRLALMAANQGLYDLNIQTGEAKTNREYALMLGYDPEEFVETNAEWIERLHPDEREKVASVYQAYIRGEIPEYRVEFRQRTKSGDWKWILSLGKIVEWDAEGNPLRMLGTHTDITARKQAEEALREEEKKYRSLYQEFQAILNTIPDTLCLISPDLKIVWGNEATASSIHQSSLSEIIGQYCYPLRHDRPEPCEDCPVVRCFRSGKLETEETFSHGNIWELRAVPLYDDLGELRGAIEVARNITERKQAEEERRKLEEQMRHVQKLESLGVLAGGIAHDFNNLLMTVLGNAELALLELSPAAASRQNVQEIRRAAHRAAELCRQMLAYSGKGKFVVEKLNLSELVKEMAHMLEVSTSKKAILRYHFPENLPPVEADPTQLRQIIMNLITNASEAIGEESGIIRVSTGVLECDRAYLEGSYYLADNLAPGSYVFLEVTDTGNGMDAATREKIFDPFFTTKFTGRGLGLAAVLGIVRGHKGAIRVYSEPGKGSTFRILLPAVPGEADQVGLKSGVEEPAWQGRGTILLIDDEEAIRRLGQQMLERLGFEVLTAADGSEGVEVYRQHWDRIVCVILDLTMPQMGGEETMGELRQIREDLRIILSSGYDEQEVTQRFASKGLAGFIQKPYTLKRLREELQRVLG
jgi:PAS domain S-box-containing protein